MARYDPYAGIKVVLQTWAKWRIDGLSGLSYPSESMEARMMEYMAIVGSTPGPRVIRYMPHIVCSNVDKIVSEWPGKSKEHNRRYLVLWTHYVGKEGKGMDLEAKLLASGCNSESTFYRVVNQAHDILIKRLQLNGGNAI